jgi:hypothetical protein
MGAAKAQFVRFVQPREPMDELVREAKHLTWEHYREHALLGLENGRRIIVSGSTFGIELQQTAPNDPVDRAASQIYVEIEGQWLRVEKLIFHTHPKSTGPSDDDLKILETLGQSSSMLYEIFGPFEGTEIRPKKR